MISETQNFAPNRFCISRMIVLNRFKKRIVTILVVKWWTCFMKMIAEKSLASVDDKLLRRQLPFHLFTESDLLKFWSFNVSVCFVQHNCVCGTWNIIPKGTNSSWMFVFMWSSSRLNSLKSHSSLFALSRRSFCGLQKLFCSSSHYQFKHLVPDQPVFSVSMAAYVSPWTSTKSTSKMLPLLQSSFASDFLWLLISRLRTFTIVSIRSTMLVISNRASGIQQRVLNNLSKLKSRFDLLNDFRMNPINILRNFYFHIFIEMTALDEMLIILSHDILLKFSRGNIIRC